MPADLAALGLDKLTVTERIDRIETLWDSLPEQVSAQEIPDWHLVELARRRAEAHANPGAGRPWRQVLAQLGDTPLASWPTVPAVYRTPCKNWVCAPVR